MARTVRSASRPSTTPICGVMALSFDRKAFIDIITKGEGDIGGVMYPPPEGLWSMPPEVLKTQC
jgi:peptide/nickel transport system substrate-binding protein